MLGFEPPHFGPNATLGGAVACGLSGPRRPYAGAARDFVLGVKMLNGRAEILSFGGQVMKNVAGFDVSRLMVGALGTLGVLLEISLKVLPRPEQDLSLTFEMGIDTALVRMNRWAGQGWPLSAACHDGERFWVRLSGAEACIAEARAALGGEVVAEGSHLWEGLREQRLAFFRGPGSLWRLSLPSATPMSELPGRWLIDWGGGLRWLRSDLPADVVFAAAREAGGHATLFRGRAEGSVFQPLSPGLRELHVRLKRAFDPNGVFNPRRMYEDW
jgi:glycolate oxidase FAD binding subunit